MSARQTWARELGAGAGHWAAALATRGVRVTALADGSAVPLGIAWLLLGCSIVAAQFVLEERVMAGGDQTPPLVVVGASHRPVISQEEVEQARECCRELFQAPKKEQTPQSAEGTAKRWGKEPAQRARLRARALGPTKQPRGQTRSAPPTGNRVGCGGLDREPRTGARVLRDGGV